MEAVICSNCQKPKAAFKCGLCANSICKKCGHFVDENQFALAKDVPAEMRGGVFCGTCFDEKVSPTLTDYDETMAKAKKVTVFYLEDATETRRYHRESKPVIVENCADNDEVLMSLAYMAVRAGYNALVDVQTSSEKVDLGGYQTSKWKGRGLPVKIERYIPNRKARVMGRDPVED